MTEVSPLGNVVAVKRSGPGLVTIRNLRFVTSLLTNNTLRSALIIDDGYDQVVVEDVELEVLSAGAAGVLINASSATDSARVTVRNATVARVTPGRGVAATTVGARPGPRVDVLNSSFERSSISYVQGASGLIQGNTLTGPACQVGTCIFVSGVSAFAQREPVRIIDNQITSNAANIGPFHRAIWLTGPTTAGFEIRGNLISGVVAADRNASDEYSFSLAGIHVANSTVAGVVSGNSVSGATFGIFVTDGTASLAGSDNLISGVQNGVGIQGGSHFMLTRSDLTDYVSAIGSAETIALGALICNWWGSAAGPVPVDPVIPEGVYAPFAVAPIAGTGMICP